MKRVALYCTNYEDATAWWRVVAPFSRLQRETDEFFFDLQLSEQFLSMSHFFDVVLMQRPYKELHLKMAIECKSRRIPLWIDYDDDLFNVPLSNPSYLTYIDDQNRNNIRGLLALADVITVTTRRLKELLESQIGKGRNIQVVPNALDLKAVPVRDLPIQTEKRVLWRGSRHHYEDVHDFIGAMGRCAKAFPEVKWYFLGSPPMFLVKREIPGAEFYAPMSGTAYWGTLQKIKPAIGVVPLVDNQFNRCKSNIAGIEYAYAGAVPLFPDWDAWNEIRGARYHDVDTFEEVLTELLEKPLETLAEIAEGSWSEVKSSFMINDINKKRARILRELLQ